MCLFFGCLPACLPKPPPRQATTTTAAAYIEGRRPFIVFSFVQAGEQAEQVEQTTAADCENRPSVI